MNERLVAVVGYDDAMLLDIACVTSTLAAANRAGADPPYRTVLAAPAATRCAATPARPFTPRRAWRN